MQRAIDCLPETTKAEEQVQAAAAAEMKGEAACWGGPTTAARASHDLARLLLRGCDNGWPPPLDHALDARQGAAAHGGPGVGVARGAAAADAEAAGAEDAGGGAAGAEGAAGAPPPEAVLALRLLRRAAAEGHEGAAARRREICQAGETCGGLLDGELRELACAPASGSARPLPAPADESTSCAAASQLLPPSDALRRADHRTTIF